MKKYDIIVVGAGPGGSTFARVAAASNLDVLLIDKKKEIGDPVRCGEGLGANWVDSDVVYIPKGAIASNITGSKIYSPDEKLITFSTPETKGYILERKIFDKYLAIGAAEKGAEIWPKTLAIDIRRDNKWIAEVKKNGERLSVEADLIVSAEGMETVIARKAGFNTTAPLHEVDTCYEYEMAGLPVENMIEIYFGNKISPRGYIWVFPKGKDVANVGIGVGGDSGANPKILLDAFIRSHERFRDAKIVEVKGGVISVGAPIDHFVSDNFMVIGTAAHMVDPIHGGGIALAIESGKMAAEAAIDAFKKKDLSQKQLAIYEKKWRASEGQKLQKRLLLRKVMEKLSDDDINFIFSHLDDEKVQAILEGRYKKIVAEILAGRPQLIKVLSALI